MRRVSLFIRRIDPLPPNHAYSTSRSERSLGKSLSFVGVIALQSIARPSTDTLGNADRDLSFCGRTKKPRITRHHSEWRKIVHRPDAFGNPDAASLEQLDAWLHSSLTQT